MLRSILSSLVALMLISVSSRSQIVVIAHPSVVVTELTKASVIDIYTLSTTAWANGAPITVLDLRRDIPAKQQFYGAIGKDAADLRKGWMRAVLTGGAKAPQGVDTEEEMLKLVASTPGAVGYVPASKLTGTVKVLLRFEAAPH